jgi:hypothetical protein
MTISLSGRLTLRELMQQAWQRVEGQARGMLKRSIEGLLQAERDRRVEESHDLKHPHTYSQQKC